MSNDYSELIASLRNLADKFSEGWHDGIRIDASDVMDLSNAADALTAKARENADLTDVLRRNGFVPCDITACNCGSWHARYGLPERMTEVKEALADAGHPLCNENGNLVSRALQELIAERDAQALELEALRADGGAAAASD